jgi:ParB/RepB/Spo0J family partition protein
MPPSSPSSPRSLREHGVVEPLIVRQIDAGSHKPMLYEIVAGERRYRAAILAELKSVPVIERMLTNEQVLELQLIENIQRDDLTALEQARGYKALIDANPGKHTAASIATRVGMSEAWVWDRLKLNDLIPEAKALLEQERIATGHGILIARQKPDDQKRIIDPEGARNRFGAGSSSGVWQTDHAALDLDDDDTKGKRDPYAGLKAVSVRELERWIADHIRFDVTHAAKAVPLEFAETASQVRKLKPDPAAARR